MIQAGKYTARAVGNAVIGTAKTGTDFIQFYLIVTEGASKGERVRWDGYFTENTNERTIKALQLLGWQGEDLSEFSDGGLHGLDSNDVEIVVELEEYQGTDEKYKGKSFPRVAWINSIVGFLNTKAAMDPGAAAAFGARMRGLVLQAKAKNPTPAAKPNATGVAPAVDAPAVDAPAADDGIPF